MEIQIRNKKTYKRAGVYVGRGWGRGWGSALGNPYSENKYGLDQCLSMYKAWLWGEIKKRGQVYHTLKRLADLANEGPLVLLCWCLDSDDVSDPVRCHAQIVRNAVIWVNRGGECGK